jgi:hypothetical protein
VYLLAVNPTGYGGPGIAASSSNASVSLLNPTLTGNAPDSIGSFVLTNNTNGGFSLGGLYSCANGYAQGTGAPVTLSSTSQVYLYVLGGTGSLSLLTNASSGLLVALGPCNSPTSHVTVNEVTTVGTAYAFAGFASDATHIGSSGSALALTNLGNAFANVANLVNTSTGVPASATAGGNGNVPVANIYTIADIIAACVNSNGSNAGPCATIFPYMESNGATGTPPMDTATATINLAHNPWPTSSGMTALWGAVPSSGAPFVGSLSSQPNDFTLVIQFPDSGLGSTVGYCAIDASGNLWVTNVVHNQLVFPPTNIPYLAEFSHTGALVSSASGYTGTGFTNATLNALAIDTSGHVWVGDGPTLFEFSSSGTLVAGSPFGASASMLNAKTLAFDASGNLWVGDDQRNKMYQFSSAGSLLATGTTSNLNSPALIAFDLSGNAWVSSYASGYLTKFSVSGSTISGTDYSGGGMAAPIGVALDNSGDIWVGNRNAAVLSEFALSGSPVSSTGYTGGGLSTSKNTQIDGSGKIWVTNYGSSSVSAFSSSGTALSPSTGYSGALNSPQWLALDGSGNVWTAGPGYVNELVGAAAPVVTPIAANLVSPYGTALVNLP